MKLVKMSLAAAVLLGASAFAIDNVKVSGDAKVFYSTNDSGTGTNTDLFDQAQSAADTALRLGVTGDLAKGISFGVTANAVSTLGLENNLVANTWTGAHYHSGSVDDQAWVSELWIAATLGKTTAKLGRMELDTPFAFSEKWSVAANTFDAAVLINQDIPDTTLVGAWVGKGNGVNVLGANGLLGVTDNRQDIDGTTAGTQALGIDGILTTNAKFTTFAKQGAYAAALVNNSFKPATVQAWYYNVGGVADAYWLQADIDCQLVKGVKIGAQYANMDPKSLLADAGVTKDSSAFAVKLGYEGVENLKVSVAYSDADNDGTLKIANVATNNLSAAQSKLYTEAWWNYGYVGAPGAESVNVTAEYNAGVAKLGAYYTSVDNDIVGSTKNVDEVTLTASKSFGPLDATLAYISTDADDQNSGSDYNTVQAYLTLNF
ncbi:MULTISPECIES: porin [unclassified Sulfuricurvum]|uniref:porin n=1 Tax=unclassified Sulfuricurvum TaxID=2632390 RepID=UPI0002998C81|nr:MULTISPECIES: porin [unclassified Sulfuricurvum]AFV96569.1 hypothetical protein B649_01275 [Candidatus Sulfuricurvum sp. RIFRC-1]HBM36027.1 porin [Sulfuricurvum sp.]